MGYVIVALVLLSLPLFLALLRQSPQHRPMAFGALALMFFLGDAVRITGNPIAWPMWMGIVKGIEIATTDTLAIALIMTRRKTADRLPFWGALLFYGLMIFLSIIPSTVKMASFFVSWEYARVLLLFAVIGGECHLRHIRSGLLGGLALGLMLQAGFVVNQKISGVVQATGTMVHQNLLGMMTELALLPLLAAMLGGDRRRILLLGVGAGLLVIAGGGSRGTIGFAGGGAAVLLLLSLCRGVTPAKTRVLGLAVLALAMAVPFAMLTLKDRFGNTSVTTLDDQRPKFEAAARAMAADHPFGVGANMYVTTANTQGYADRAGVAWNFFNRSASVHNAYLLARAETGWLGELGLILILCLPVVYGIKFAMSRRSGAGGEVALGSVVALGVNIVHNNYEFVFFTYSTIALVLMNIGLVAAQLQAFARQKTSIRRPGTPQPDIDGGGYLRPRLRQS